MDHVEDSQSVCCGCASEEEASFLKIDIIYVLCLQRPLCMQCVVGLPLIRSYAFSLLLPLLYNLTQTQSPH